jgi:hypothetical protein
MTTEEVMGLSRGEDWGTGHPEEDDEDSMNVRPQFDLEN